VGFRLGNLELKLGSTLGFPLGLSVILGIGTNASDLHNPNSSPNVKSTLCAGIC
jgi:hypothetical protein